MRNAIYRDKDGRLVRVERTRSGFLLRYPDGTISTVGLQALVAALPLDRPAR